MIGNEGRVLNRVYKGVLWEKCFDVCTCMDVRGRYGRKGWTSWVHTSNDKHWMNIWKFSQVENMHWMNIWKCSQVENTMNE